MRPAQFSGRQPADVYVDPVTSFISTICASVKRLFLISSALQVGQTLHHDEGTSGWQVKTLAYFWRLNVSFHPRNDCQSDIKTMPSDALILVGDKEEAVDGAALLKDAGYQGNVEILARSTHFGVLHAPEALKRAADCVASIAEP